jgi:hypothetical protein
MIISSLWFIHWFVFQQKYIFVPVKPAKLLHLCTVADVQEDTEKR